MRRLKSLRSRRQECRPDHHGKGAGGHAPRAARETQQETEQHDRNERGLDERHAALQKNVLGKPDNGKSEKGTKDVRILERP